MIFFLVNIGRPLSLDASSEIKAKGFFFWCWTVLFNLKVCIVYSMTITNTYYFLHAKTAPREDRTLDLQITLFMWLWDWRAAYCAIEASGVIEEPLPQIMLYLSVCLWLLANSSTKTSSSAGFEPATSGLEVRRAIHCATKTGDSRVYDSWNLAFIISVGGVKVSIVAFQAIDPGSIPGRRTRFFLLARCSLFY